MRFSKISVKVGRHTGGIYFWGGLWKNLGYRQDRNPPIVKNAKNEAPGHHQCLGWRRQPRQRNGGRVAQPLISLVQVIQWGGPLFAFFAKGGRDAAWQHRF